MSDQPTCPGCGQPLSVDAPRGLCMACLLRQGATGQRSNVEPTESRGSPSDSHFTPPSVEELTPKFPQLEVLELMGRGGMGAVYKARQLPLDRIVALKILPVEVGREPAFRERFLREARALAKLAHPNIVIVFEFGQSDDLYYLLMEYVEGITLRMAMQQGQLTAAQALAIVPQICDALQYAHEEGVVHRDIKPENVLLDKRGRVKIVDFGLAKLLQATPADFTLTATHQIMGTLRYMAPEQIENPLHVDHRADIYSLGVVFYELLTGELPLGRFALPSERKLDQRLDHVVLRTLEHQPDRRYQHASDVKMDVERISRQAEAPEAPPGPSTESPSPGPPPKVPPRTVPSSQAVRLPFVIQDAYGGFANADGILRFDGRQLSLEYQVKDNIVGALSSPVRMVHLPLDRIISIELGSGIFSRRLHIQTDYLQLTAGIPNSQRGLVSLHIHRRDRHLAETLVDWVRSGRPGTGFASSPPRGTASPAAEASPEAGRRQVHAAAIGMLIVAALNLAPLALAILGVAFRLLVRLDMTREPFSISAQISDALSSGTLIQSSLLLSAITGGMFLASGLAARQLGPRPLAIGGAVVGLIPFGPLWIINFPFSIWYLSTLNREDSRLAFTQARQGGKENSRLPAKPDDPESLLRAVRVPGAGLLVAGILNGALAIAICCILFIEYGWSANTLLRWSVALLLLPAILGSSLAFGAAHLLAMRSYSAAKAACILAVLPCTLGFLVSLPFGILGLMRLSEPGIRRHFASP